MRKVINLLFVFVIAIAMCLVVEVDAATTINPHIKTVYEYNQDGSGTGENYTGCLGGAEAGCTDILSSKDGSSTYEVGTIIKYEVADGVEKYFNVIKDNGTTLTLQQRENTVNSKAWYGTSDNYTNENGPATTSGYALYELEQATSSWTNVNDQTYSIGDNTTTLGYSGCIDPNNCAVSKYTLTREAKKARMITIQETNNLGCTTTDMSCPKFMNNYLASNVSYGGTFRGSNPCYWTMSAHSAGSTYAWYVHNGGLVHNNLAYYTNSGARAVVVIDKSSGEVSIAESSGEVSIAESSGEVSIAESNATNEGSKESNQGEIVKTEDTLKMSYFGYIMGLIAIVAGAYVIYLGIERKYENKE